MFLRLRVRPTYPDHKRADSQTSLHITFCSGLIALLGLNRPGDLP